MTRTMARQSAYPSLFLFLAETYHEIPQGWITAYGESGSRGKVDRPLPRQWGLSSPYLAIFVGRVCVPHSSHVS